MKHYYFQWLKYGAGFILAIVIYGCNLSEMAHSAHLSPDEFYSVLELEHHAINLSTVAPYNTLILKTRKETGDGTVLPGEVEYSVSSSSISVTDGVLTAISPVAKAFVRATFTYKGIKRTDSAAVSVVGGVPNQLRDFGMRLNAGDSAKVGLGAGSMRIPLIREGMNGATLSTLLVHSAISDITVASISQSGNNISINPGRPGRVMVYVSTFAYGQSWNDSLEVIIGWPVQFSLPTSLRYVNGTLNTFLDFAYKDIMVGVGACVLWGNMSEVIDLDVRFEDPTNVLAPVGHSCAQAVLDPDVGGDIAPFRFIPYDGTVEGAYISYLSPRAARVFSKVGEYKYSSTLHDTHGIVRVCDENNDTTCAPRRMGGWY